MSQTNEQFRLRVCYRKDGRLAYLGHLEIINTINRCIRRSQLPFAVSNGFAHRIKLQFSQALPVGASSTGEYFDLYLRERIAEDEALDLLQKATPYALAPEKLWYVARSLPALEAWLNRSDWAVGLNMDGLSVEQLESALEEVQKEETLSYLRGQKTKQVNLARCLVGWDFVELKDHKGLLRLKTRSSNEGALRPAVLMNAAFNTEQLKGTLMPSLRVIRIGQWHEQENGSLVEPSSVHD